HLDVALHHLVLELAADEALDGEQGVLRVGHRLALGGLAHQHLGVLAEGNHRGGGAIALTVLDHARLAAFHDGDARVGRAEVDANYLSHGFTPDIPALLLKGQTAGFQAPSGARATITRAGRSRRPFSSYPGCTTSSTELAGASFDSRAIMASWRAGSKDSPCALMGVTPSRSSARFRSCRVASWPSLRLAASAREALCTASSRVSFTGRSS